MCKGFLKEIKGKMGKERTVFLSVDEDRLSILSKDKVIGEVYYNDIDEIVQSDENHVYTMADDDFDHSFKSITIRFSLNKEWVLRYSSGEINYFSIDYHNLLHAIHMWSDKEKANKVEE